MTYYDAIAKGYNELHKEEQLKKIRIILRTIFDVKRPVLDVGCGTGFSLDIFHENWNVECVGIDPSRKMIELYEGNQKIMFGMGEMLPFDDESFGLVLSITAIQNFTDPLQGILEMKRVCSLDGQIVISCLKKSAKLDEITEHIAENLVVREVIEEEKDMIFFCGKE